jgi:hypothetical protein
MNNALEVQAEAKVVEKTQELTNLVTESSTKFKASLGELAAAYEELKIALEAGGDDTLAENEEALNAAVAELQKVVTSYEAEVPAKVKEQASALSTQVTAVYTEAKAKAELEAVEASAEAEAQAQIQTVKAQAQADAVSAQAKTEKENVKAP